MNDTNVNREVVRLRKELAALQADHEQAMAAKQAELDAAGRVAEALGKAIALLHAGSESADSTTGQ